MRPRRVLLVEDHLFSRRVLTDQLVLAQYRVVATASAEEALSRFAATPVDIVLTDLHLAGLSGCELTLALRKAGRRGATVPIFGMTAGRVEDDWPRCAATGMTTLIAKPLSVARFKAMADRHCEAPLLHPEG